jgi:hypothetical protein
LKLANKNKGFGLICDKSFSGHSHKLRYNRLRDFHRRDYKARNIRPANGAPLRCARQISCALVNVLALPPAGALEALEAAACGSACLLKTLASAAMTLASAAQILDSFFFTHFLDSGRIYFRRAGHRAFGHLSRPHDQ